MCAVAQEELYYNTEQLTHMATSVINYYYSTQRTNKKEASGFAI